MTVLSATPWGCAGLHDFTDTPADASTSIGILVDAGITWCRVPIAWSVVQPNEATETNWGTDAWNYDSWIPALYAAGIKVTVTVYSPASWSARVTGSALCDPTKLAVFIRQLLTRYNGMIECVQIGNEDVTGSSLDSDRYPGNYIPGLIAGYNAVKTFDPSILVMLCGLWDCPLGWLREFYQDGSGTAYYDVLDFHYYQTGKGPAGQDVSATGGGYLSTSDSSGNAPLNWYLLYLYKIVVEYGEQAKQIWIGEYGWAISNEGGHSAANAVTRQHQADYIESLMNTVLASGIVQRASVNYLVPNNDGYALVHKDDFYARAETSQPILNGGITIGASTLNTTSWDANRWPSEGVLLIDSEQIYYAAFASNQATGLSRGYNGTTAAIHNSDAQITNQDLSTMFERLGYTALKDVATAHPTLMTEDVGFLPDVPSTGTEAYQTSDETISWGSSKFSTGTYWTNIAGAGNSRAWDATVFHTSTGSVKIVKGESGAVTRGTGLTDSYCLAATEVRSYRLTGWIKIAPTSGAEFYASIYVAALDASNVTMQLFHSGPDGRNFWTDGQWHYVEFGFVPPTDATKLQINLTVTGSATGSAGEGTAWFDDILLEGLDVEGGHMARAYFRDTIQDSQGNALIGASVQVETPAGVLLTDTLYSAATGSAVLPNPFTATGAVVEFYTEDPQFVQLRVSLAGWTTVTPVVSLTGPDVAGDLEITGPGQWADARAYGAVGDGDTDDTAACQAAITAVS